MLILFLSFPDNHALNGMNWRINNISKFEEIYRLRCDIWISGDRAIITPFKYCNTSRTKTYSKDLKSSKLLVRVLNSDKQNLESISESELTKAHIKNYRNTFIPWNQFISRMVFALRTIFYLSAEAWLLREIRRVYIVDFIYHN